MTSTYNIAGTDSSIMVPVLSETGSQMAYRLYPDPTEILQDPRLPGNGQAIPGQYLGNTWAIAGESEAGTVL